MDLYYQDMFSSGGGYDARVCCPTLVGVVDEKHNYYLLNENIIIKQTDELTDGPTLIFSSLLVVMKPVLYCRPSPLQTSPPHGRSATL